MHQSIAASPALLDRIHSEFAAHTERHKVGGGWGTFRSLASVLQVAATLVLAFGFAVQFPFIRGILLSASWLQQLVPSPFELLMLAIVTAPEWCEVFFFTRAQAVLRDTGVLKRMSSDPPPGRVPNESALRILWFGQILSRLANIAVHVIFAVLLAAAIFYGVTRNLRDTPGLPNAVAPLQSR